MAVASILRPGGTRRAGCGDARRRASGGRAPFHLLHARPGRLRARRADVHPRHRDRRRDGAQADRRSVRAAAGRARQSEGRRLVRRDVRLVPAGRGRGTVRRVPVAAARRAPPVGAAAGERDRRPRGRDLPDHPRVRHEPGDPREKAAGGAALLVGSHEARIPGRDRALEPGDERHRATRSSPRSSRSTARTAHSTT